MDERHCARSHSVDGSSTHGGIRAIPIFTQPHTQVGQSDSPSIINTTTRGYSQEQAEDTWKLLSLGVDSGKFGGPDAKQIFSVDGCSPYDIGLVERCICSAQQSA